MLVYAHRADTAHHALCRSWLEAVVNGEHAYALSEPVLAGFLRAVTHPKVFARPSPMAEALAFAAQLRERPNCVLVAPGPRHWEIFRRLCVESGVKRNLVPDAYLAALAIEPGCERVTTDRDFSRFTGLRWRHPAESRIV